MFFLLAFIWSAMQETNKILLENTFSSNFDFSVIRALNVQVILKSASSIKVVNQTPPLGQIKVNTDGSDQGVPDASVRSRGVFRTYKDLSKVVFLMLWTTGSLLIQSFMPFIFAVENAT